MTQPNFRIKKGDFVEVTTGRDKGRRGTVEKVILKDGKVIVENINMVTKHQRPTQTSEGGRIRKALPLNISNVALVDPTTDRPGKVGYKIDEQGNKVRFFKKTGSLVSQGQVS